MSIMKEGKVGEKENKVGQVVKYTQQESQISLLLR